MFIFGLLWSWVKGHSPTQLFHAGCVLALGLFCAYEIVHQRNIGYDECKAEDAKATAAAQASADKVSSKANAELHADLDEITQPLPGYLQVYGDKTKAADCAPVSYVRKLKP